jgi:hypothetical protein
MFLMKPSDDSLFQLVREHLHFIGFLLRNSTCSFITTNVSLFSEFVELIDDAGFRLNRM